MTQPPQLSGVFFCEVSGVASREPSSATLHVTRLFRWPCHQPSLCPLRNSGTLHVLPRATAPPGALRGLFTSLVALAVCRSPARLSELTLLNTHLHVLLSSLLRADSPQHAPPPAGSELLVLQRRSHTLHTLPVGSLNSCHKFSVQSLKTESNCTNNNDNDKRSESCSVSSMGHSAPPWRT